MSRSVLLALLGLFLLGPASKAATWLPSETLFPRHLASPLEPRMAITAHLDGDQMDAALGQGIPIVQFGDTHPGAIQLEAAALFTLGRDGSFFPLQTFDGLVGLGFETERQPFFFRLRLMHQSAHLADGDSTVTFRGKTFSREYATTEVAYAFDRSRRFNQAVVYGGLSASWHAVPEDKLRLHVGGHVQTHQGLTLGLHLSLRDTDSAVLRRHALLGWTFKHTMFLGLRYGKGDAFQGQREGLPVEDLSFELRWDRNP